MVHNEITPYKVLSLGWGVQSFTLAAMSALGEFEMPDVAIHADTTHESKLTYEFKDRWRWWLHDKGLKIITVKPDQKKLSAFNQWRGVFIPAYTSNGKTNGQLRRQCTGDWKIAPIRRYIQANRNKRPVELWIGISTDEALRMKPSDAKYITNRWPLIELGMSRKDCIKYLNNFGIEVPPRSACTFCPYHSTEEWRRIKENSEDWKNAMEHDMAIRKMRPPFDLFVHPSRKPLAEVDLRTLEEKGQMRLWDEECEGICGI